MTLVEFFAKYIDRKIIVDAETGCWLWIGATDKNGYGRYGVYENGVRVRQPMVHVYVWELAHIDEQRDLSKVIMHECNHRNCCNPTHLEQGTQSQNTKHSVTSGTHYMANKGKAKRQPIQLSFDFPQELRYI